MSDRFFAPGELSPGEYVLGGPEAHHLATVRRIGPGDRVVLFNGDGNEYPAEVLSTDRKRVVLTVLGSDPVSRELGFRLEVAAALPKSDRGDFLVEKLTELGVTRFTPLQTVRTVVQPKDSRLDKLQHGVVEASKQCGRNTLMQIAPLTRWASFATDPGLPPLRLMLHTEGAGTPSGGLPLDEIRSVGVVFAIGPEGGFDEGEVAAAMAAGWRLLGLGPRVLRVETAAIAVAAWAAQVSSPGG